LLEKDPGLRYQTAADLRADLKRLHRDTTSGYGVRPQSGAAVSAAVRSANLEAPPKRFPKWAIALLVLVAIGAAGAVGWVASRGRGSSDVPPVSSSAPTAAPGSPTLPAVDKPQPPLTEPAPIVTRKDDAAAAIKTASKPAAKSATPSIADQQAVQTPAPPSAPTGLPTASDVSAPMTSASLPDSKSHPCEFIKAVCENAGFVPMKAKEGIGIAADCVVPIVQSKPQPAAATKPLPQVDPAVAASCHAVNPHYYEGKERRQADEGSSNP